MSYQQKGYSTKFKHLDLVDSVAMPWVSSICINERFTTYKNENINSTRR